jgi:hypothetical protein
MDNRSKKLVELFEKIKTAIGQGDVCALYTIAPGTEPDIEITIEAKTTGQIVKFHLWKAEVEQWRDVDPITKTPVSGPTHLKIIGEIAKTEQISPPKKEEIKN